MKQFASSRAEVRDPWLLFSLSTPIIPFLPPQSPSDVETLISLLSKSSTKPTTLPVPPFPLPPNPCDIAPYSFAHRMKIPTLKLCKALSLSLSLAKLINSSRNLLLIFHISSDGEVNNLGVKAALSMLRFYKREISPILPRSCRYVPTCSEYSMEAYKRYGVLKGTVLTAWRLCRCNPLGGYGYDPPRWFSEIRPEEEVDD